MSSMITFVVFHVHYRPELGTYLRESRICQKNSMLAQFRRVAAGRIDYQTMLEILFRSIDLTHRENRKMLLTDRGSSFQWPEDLNVDVVRGDIDVTRLMLSRLQSQVSFLRDCDDRSHYVFVDSDMIVNRDLAPVFANAFDVAVTYRPSHPMPINGGIIFVHRSRLSQAREVFRELLHTYETRYLDQDVWWGDQFALRDILNLHSGDQLQDGILPGLPYQVLLLDAESYNYSATGMDILACAPDKYILHFKSWQKAYMLSYWERWIMKKRSPDFAIQSLRLRGTLWRKRLRRMARKAYHELARR